MNMYCDSRPTVMIQSFQTYRSGQRVQTQIRQTAPRGAVCSESSLFAIPFASF